jgi:HNH endonuclease
MAQLDIDEIRAAFDYEPETGALSWKRFDGRNKKGIAGTLDKSNGYLRIGLGGISHGAHRIVWAHFYGQHPCGFIDHINGDRSDNRISNLRIVTRSQNNTNRGPSSRNKLGVKGVSLSRGKYRVMIKAGDKHHFIGRFDTIDEASAAYKEASVRLHGEYSWHN